MEVSDESKVKGQGEQEEEKGEEEEAEAEEEEEGEEEESGVLWNARWQQIGRKRTGSLNFERRNSGCRLRLGGWGVGGAYACLRLCTGKE